MNSFFKKIVISLSFIFLTAMDLFAIDIHSIYTASCKRELGVILNINDAEIQLLNLKGKITRIPRFKIIYMTIYSVENLPHLESSELDLERAIKIETLQDDQIIELVSGWPIDYSKNNISFLNLKGQETIISRDNIWKLKITEKPSKIIFSSKLQNNYKFIHPYPFRQCQKDKSTEKGDNTVYPEKLLKERIQIKKELDRLAKGKEKVLNYNRWQQFYSVPHIYKNITTLGYWVALGSRYGSSKFRTNNLAPIVENQFSTGPFGYQHMFLTGSAPMIHSVIEEPQTQIYYRLKVNYVHMAAMADPNFFLLTSDTYNWTKDSMKYNDARLNEMFSGEFGLDYGYFSIQGIVSAVPLGIYIDDEGSFFGTTIVPRAGITFRNHLFSMEVQYGIKQPQTTMQTKLYDDLLVGFLYSNDGYSPNHAFDFGEIKNDHHIQSHRINFKLKTFKSTTIIFSTLYRVISLNTKSSISLDGRMQYSLLESMIFNSQLTIDDPSPYDTPERIQEVKDNLALVESLKNNFDEAEKRLKESEFQFNSTSITNAIYITYNYSHQLSLGLFTALEYIKNEYSFDNIDRKDTTINWYPKFGLRAALIF